jgi:hypothetical protein
MINKQFDLLRSCVDSILLQDRGKFLAKMDFEGVFHAVLLPISSDSK